jgi:hypothetical protein
MISEHGMHRRNGRHVKELLPTRFSYRGLVAIVLVCAFTAVAGCNAGGSKGTAHLQGTVTIDGKPIPADATTNIMFRATTQGQAKSTSTQIVDGIYDAPDAPLGKVMVYIDIQQPTGKMKREGIGTPYAEYRDLIATKYDEGIPLEVTDDNSKQNFDLESSK